MDSQNDSSLEPVEDENQDLLEPVAQENQDLLEQFSDLLERAIRGIFVFIWKGVTKTLEFVKESIIYIFWTLPKKFLAWLISQVNFFMRLLLVTSQLLVLIGIIFGPLVWSLYLPVDSSLRPLEQSDSSPSLIQLISGGWCLISLIGAVWGVSYLKKWKFRQAVGKLLKKVKFW